MLMRAVIGMLLAGLALGFGSQPAAAQSAIVVATCGTLPGSVTWTERQSRQVTVDINGVLCTSAGGTGGAGDASAANQVTGNNTLASILAKQPSLGTAGTASSNVLTVQGITSMTPLLVNGSGFTQPVSGTVTVTQGTGTNLHVVCDSGCSSSTAPADESAFTAGTTPMSPIGGFFQTTATNNALTNGQAGAWQMTAQRAGFINLRNASGAEIGVAAAPVQVSVANTGANATAVKVDGSAVTQPVSGTVTAAQATAGNLNATVVGTGTFSVQASSVVPGTGATNLGKAEDAAHTTGDVGVMALGVRNDSGTALAGTDGDYIPLSIDANGALRVTGGGGGTEYTEDAAAAANPVGPMMMAVRRDTLSTSEVSADGDNIALKATNKGELRTSDADLLAAMNAAVPAGTNVIGKVGIDQTTDGTTNLVVAKQATAANLNATVVGTGTFATQAVPTAGTTGGATTAFGVAANTNNSTSVKGSAGVVYSVQVYNNSATIAYLKLYNKATAPTCGTDTPVKVIGIPGNTSLGGNNVSFGGGTGAAFGTGIGICIVTGIANSDNTAVAANAYVYNIDYK